MNLPLIRADSGKEVVVEIQPIYRATVDRTITFYEGVRYPLFWKLFRHDALFLLIGVLLVIFGIFYLLIGVYYRMKMQSALYLSPLGMVAVLVGLWKIADTRLITWLIPGHALFFSYLSMFSIMFAPFFVALYIHMSARKTGSIRKVTSVLLVVNAVLVLAAFAAHLLRLLALREAANLVYLAKDAQKQGEMEAMAGVIAASFGVPAAMPVVKMALAVCWAFAESILDLRELLDGGKVALFKTAESWQLSLEQLPKLLETGDQSRKNAPGGMEYSDYLRLLLMQKSGKAVTFGAMDLVEYNMRTEQQQPVFRLDCCVDELEAGFTAVIGKREYEITRNYGYEMQGAA